jgi:glycosidase
MMLAEASQPDLMVKAFDADYAWPMLGTLNDVLIKGQPASRIRTTWEDSARQFPIGTLHMRMTDDHDEPRAIARYGARGALAGSALMLTLDGVPLIYNGMEVGDATESGDPALFEKLPIFWAPKDRPPLRKIYHSLIELRKQNSALRTGKVAWLHSSDEANLVCFKRTDGKDDFVVVINFSSRPVKADIDANPSEEYKPVAIAGMPRVPDQDFPTVHLGGFDWRVYHRTVNPVEASVSSPSPIR